MKKSRLIKVAAESAAAAAEAGRNIWDDALPKASAVMPVPSERKNTVRAVMAGFLQEEGRRRAVYRAAGGWMC